MKKVGSKTSRKQVKVKGESGENPGTRTKIVSETARSRSRLTQSKSNLNPVRKARTTTNKSKPLATEKSPKSKLTQQRQKPVKGLKKKDPIKSTKSKIEINQKARAELIKQYESGIKLINKHEFSKARDIFEKAIRSNGKDEAISERIRTYLQLCEKIKSIYKLTILFDNMCK